MALLEISARLLGRLSWRNTVYGAPAAAAAAKAVADVALSGGRFGAASIERVKRGQNGGWLDGWWTGWNATNREEKKKNKNSRKTRGNYLTTNKKKKKKNPRALR